MTNPALSKMLVALRGVFFASAFVLLWAWLAVSVRRFDAQLEITIPAWLRPMGLVLAAAGALVAAICIATFVTKGRGTPAPFDPPRQFVASGPYRFVRNPMYLGASMVLLGAGLALSSPSILLLGFAFLMIAHLFVVLYEEPGLTGRFGDSYLQYKASVGRWLVRRPKPDEEPS
ncbi:MAG TPA: isoprenylcysteine carboxylmethyltransferase family protein [Thermoanaerobaculia bacterium]|jgi:protein-S-isoprenylcysteine O-methyltransferase Ste14|nr:isoprenylcysteine carboxylmethyltransferase family protein [Thermoanaerobaculia bacterium]